jgi:hypothetical protein
MLEDLEVQQPDLILMGLTIGLSILMGQIMGLSKIQKRACCERMRCNV